MFSPATRVALRTIVVAVLCSAVAGAALADETLDGQWRGKFKVKGATGPGSKGVMDLVVFQSGAFVSFSGNVYFSSTNGVPSGLPDQIAYGSFTLDGTLVSGTITTDDLADTIRGYLGKVNGGLTKMKWQTSDGGDLTKYKFKKLHGNEY